MNPVLLLTHNNLELTKRCIASVQAQDVPTSLFVVDNGSRDGTWKWLTENSIRAQGWWNNRGVSSGWNFGISDFLSHPEFSKVLVIGNDTVLAPWFYRELMSYYLPFVTGVAVDNMEQLTKPGSMKSVSPHPDFSAFLIRRDCWQKVGPFDERMVHYASDCDFHVRAQKKGMALYKANCPYYHERSSTLRLASPEERCEIESQANKDRAVFRSIYNCSPGEPAYEAIFLTPQV